MTVVKNIKDSIGAFYGVCAITGVLHSMGIFATRPSIRDTLCKVDPEGVALWYVSVLLMT